jgi:phage-related protein
MSEADGWRDLVWVASTKKDLKATPEEVQDKVGYALELVQAGEEPTNAEQMKGALRDVWAIKVEDDDGATYRTTYVTVLGDDVYVLDTFKKKSTKGIATPQKDLDRIENRLKRAREIYAKRQSEKS